MNNPTPFTHYTRRIGAQPESTTMHDQDNQARRPNLGESLMAALRPQPGDAALIERAQREATAILAERETIAHTPGPWCLVGGAPDVTVCKPGDGYVTHVAKLHDAWICDEHGGSAFANARRIVACVNACHGIADPAAWIESAKVNGIAPMMNAEAIDDLTAQRDYLLAALRGIEADLKSLQPEHVTDAMLDAMHAAARAAIARATGGAA